MTQDLHMQKTSAGGSLVRSFNHLSKVTTHFCGRLREVRLYLV